MSWYIRKAVHIGPVRFNLSKSGIGASVGVPGFRIGIKPNGRSYLHYGANGFYVREDFGGNKEQYKGLLILPEQETKTSGNTIFYNTSTKDLKSDYKADLVKLLTKSYRGFRYDYLVAAITAIALFTTCIIRHTRPMAIKLLWNPQYITIYYTALLTIIAIGFLIFVVVAKWEKKRRRIDLIYEFENNNFEYYENILTAFNEIAKCKKVWRVISQQNLDSHGAKIHAGAWVLTDRTDAFVGEGKLPWVYTNITSIPIIKTNECSLYFMPDGILVYDKKGIAYVDYLEINISSNSIWFTEYEEVPEDAIVVGYSWQYANKNGSPDRRFKNNFQIPECVYGTLKMTTKDGKLLLDIETSKKDAPKDFEEAMAKVRRILSKKQTRSIHK